jgi:hemoglobin
MTTTLYEAIGGDAVVRRIVARFYDAMDQDPTAATVRAMHPPDLTESRDKLYWFLSGWLGGPSLYVERRGHPMLRARHLPFAVDDRARDVWMACMRTALAAEVPDPNLRIVAEGALERLATHMINRPSPT